MKFRIKDDYGENYEVEEIQDDDFAETEEIDETITDDDIIMENEDVHDEALSDDEISALKRLASVADKLIALLPSDDEIHDEDEIEEEEEITDADEEEEIDETITDEDESEEEEVIDTNPIGDSFGSLERRRRKSKDSKMDNQEKIANKWQQNYANFNK